MVFNSRTFLVAFEDLTYIDDTVRDSLFDFRSNHASNEDDEPKIYKDDEPKIYKDDEPKIYKTDRLRLQIL